MENSHQSTDGKIRDFCDGEYYKEHPLFSFDKTALQLFLYYDDFEICNPLGSRVKKQKIGRCLCFHCSASVMKGLYITGYNKLSNHAILSTNEGRIRGFLRSNFKLISLPSRRCASRDSTNQNASFVEFFSRLERAVLRGIWGEIFALFQVCAGNFDTIPPGKVVGTLYLASSCVSFKYFAFLSVCDKFELLGHVQAAMMI